MITFIIKSAEIFDLAQRHLGALAKRATDDNGNTDFKHFMLQSNETEIIDTYVQEAVSRICAFCPERVRHSTPIAVGQHVIIIDGGRDRNYVMESSDLWEPKDTKPQGTKEGSDKELITNTAISFVLNHVLDQYLSNSASPQYAEKYNAESTRLLADLRNLIYIKEPPSTTYSLSETTGSCS